LHYLENFENTWNKKYPYISKSWRTTGTISPPSSSFPAASERFIYTTNLIENINRIIHKYTKTKTMLPNDQAVEKVVYLALMQVSKKWTMPQETGPTCSYLYQYFCGQRYEVKT
jgi:transposase-like protein